MMEQRAQIHKRLWNQWNSVTQRMAEWRNEERLYVNLILPTEISELPDLRNRGQGKYFGGR